MYSPREVDFNITAESATWNTEDDQLQVNWEDGHTSHYSFEWLKYLRYRPPGEGQPDGVLRKGIKLWGQELSEEGNMPTFQFEKLLNDEQELYKWLVTLEIETGIAKIQNVPKEGDQLPILGERVGYLMRSCFGDFLEIRAFGEKGGYEIGYSDSFLPIHTDFTYNHFAPAVVMLRCIEQTKGEGGTNLWVDGFHAANVLFQEDPESFQILVNTPVVFRNFTQTKFGQVYCASRRCLIRVDHEKKLEQTSYSYEFRHNHMLLEPKLMKSFYKAYFRYSELLVDKKTSFWYKMKSGDLMTTNNYRVLDARSEFKDRSDNVRLLELGYFDLDCVHSKIRLLAEKQGIPSPVD